MSENSLKSTVAVWKGYRNHLEVVVFLTSQYVYTMCLIRALFYIELLCFTTRFFYFIKNSLSIWFKFPFWDKRSASDYAEIETDGTFYYERGIINHS